MIIQIHTTPVHHQVCRIGYAKDSKGVGYLVFDQREKGVLVQPERSRKDFTKACVDADAGANVLSSWWYPPSKGEKLPAWPATVAEILEGLAWTSARRSAALPSPAAPLASTGSDEPRMGSLDF
jgi:hypothetical protein